jgi:two-component system OmpR family response regulator
LGKLAAMRILVIEDDPDAGTVLAFALTELGHETACARDFAQGSALVKSTCFDALIVDRRLPGGDGINLVASLRARNITTPAIFLTALGEVDDRIAGLRAGGDDYIVKPFAFLELLARLEAIMRRRGALSETVLQVGDLEMNLIARTVKRADTEIPLQPCEFRLLEFLMRRPGQTVTRSMLLEGIWKYQSEGSRILDVHVSRLRRKIDQGADTPLIHTVWGSGYCIRAD